MNQNQAKYQTRERVILSLGRVEGYKNIDAVIAALPHLPADFKLQVIGDGSARPDLARRVARDRLQGRVEFLGPVDDDRVDEALSAAGVLVTMSSHEAFGLAALEALAAGVPVVASDIPAHTELRDRYARAGMTLVPIDAPPSELARTIAEAAASSFRPPDDLPSWDRVADSTLSLYEGLVAEADR